MLQTNLKKEITAMIENALVRNNASLKIKITVKALISAGIIALAVILPQLAHLTFGQSAGIMLLPMYLPYGNGGCRYGRNRDRL